MPSRHFRASIETKTLIKTKARGEAPIFCFLKSKLGKSFEKSKNFQYFFHSAVVSQIIYIFVPWETTWITTLHFWFQKNEIWCDKNCKKINIVTDHRAPSQLKAEKLLMQSKQGTSNNPTSLKCQLELKRKRPQLTEWTQLSTMP